MNHSPARPLRHNYLLLRHGHSLANEQALIVSSPEVGVDRFGLSERGKAEVARAVRDHDRELVAVSKIYASDFLRTRQTAELVAAELSVDVELTPSLRERWFGQFDGQSNQHYESVWESDRRDPSHGDGGVESVAAVAARMTRLITDLDRQGPGQGPDQTILIVSHGDPLQILLTAIGGIDLSQHRSVAPIQTAEIRSLRSAPRR